MRRNIFALILVVAFSFNSCSDDDDEWKEDSSIKFTDKFEMTEWQREGVGDDYIYFRFESDYQVYIKQWNISLWNEDCYFSPTDLYLLEYPDQKITILVNTENYLKYNLQFDVDRVIEYNMSYENGIMEMKKYDRGVKLESSWEKSETDLNTLELCERFL